MTDNDPKSFIDQTGPSIISLSILISEIVRAEGAHPASSLLPVDFTEAIKAALPEATDLVNKLYDKEVSIKDFVQLPPISSKAFLLILGYYLAQRAAISEAALQVNYKFLAPKKAGGSARGEQRKEEAGTVEERVIRKWHQLSATPEHNRAAKISEALGMPIKTIRRHIKNAGVRTEKKRPQAMHDGHIEELNSGT